jgi:DNA-binding PadR family transcriptional regulator
MMGEIMRDMHDIWKKLDKLGRYGGYGGLKAWVLYTLGERPKNGAEIMDAIEAMSYGSWRPSPGSIYPMLNKMVEDNLIRKREDGRYEPVKDEYEEANSFGQWSQGKYTVESAVKEMDSYISYLEDLPREKVKPFEDQIARINDRLQKLKESL